MLYKKELSDIPVGKMPKIDEATRCEFAATAKVVELKRSGKILVVDFFQRKDESHAIRFCTDGKNYLTMNVWKVWTEQNPRTWMGYGSAAACPQDVKIAKDFLHSERRYVAGLLELCHHILKGLRLVILTVTLPYGRIIASSGLAVATV